MGKLKGSGRSSPAVGLRRVARLGVAAAAVVAALGSATAASAQPRAAGADTLPTKVAVAQVVLSNGDTDVFYVGSNGQVNDWSYVAGWTHHQLGTGEKVKAGTGIAAVQQSNGNISVYYVGSSNGEIYNWLYTTSTGWINGIIAEGEKAAAGTGVTQVQNPNGTQNVYYVGANDQIFNWYFNGTHWSNGQLGNGEAAKPTSGITSVYQPANGDEQVFYVGANGQIYNWLFSTTEGWLNGPIGSGEKAAAGSQLTDVYQSSDGDQNVFYVGANNQIWNWGYTEEWNDNQISHSDAAIAGSGISSVLLDASQGSEQVFYTGTNGQMQSSLFNGFTWGNGVIGTGEAAQAGSALTASIFSGGQENIYYMGANSTVYNWEGSPGSWFNYQLP
jgi:hypothetical protein